MDFMEKERVRLGRSSSMDALFPDLSRTHFTPPWEGQQENLPKFRDSTSLSMRSALKNYLYGFVNDTMMSNESRRISTLGKTGSGKSSLANTIFGENFFEYDFNKRSSISIEAKEVEGRSIPMIDTPGVFDTASDKKFDEKMINSIIDMAPGPHAFLLLLKVEKSTHVENEIIETFVKLFGKEALKYTTVVFTHGDEVEQSNQSIEEFIRGNDVLKKLISDCGNRYQVFNIEKKERSQVAELMEKIDDLVNENGGKYYTNNVLQEAEVNVKMERNYKVDGEKVKQKNTNPEKDLHRKYETKKYMNKYMEGALSMFKELLKKCIIVA